MQNYEEANAGKGWCFRVEGTRVHVKGADCVFTVFFSRGMRYLMQLMQYRDTLVRFEQLDGAYASPGRCYHQFRDESTTLESGLKVQDRLEPLQMTDNRTIRELKQRLLCIVDELVLMEENNDYGRADELRDEQDKLCEYLKEVYRPCGKLRNFPDENSKLKRRVIRAIHRAIEDIRKESTMLAMVIEDSLEVGEYLLFRSEGPDIRISGL